MNVRSIICIWTVALVAVAVAVPLVEVDGVLDGHPPVVEEVIVDGVLDLGDDSRDGVIDDGTDHYHNFDGFVDINYLDRDGIPFVMQGNVDQQVISSLPAFVPLAQLVEDETATADGFIDVAYVVKPLQAAVQVEAMPVDN